MEYLEYGAPGLISHAGQVLALPPASSGLSGVCLISEGPAPVRFCWRAGAQRTDLATLPDGFDSIPYADAAAVAATSLLVGCYVGRLRLVRYAPSEWGALPWMFAPPPQGMSQQDATEQALMQSPLPAGFQINRGG